MEYRSSSTESGTHENYIDRIETRVGSDRQFGIVFAFFFAIIACIPLLGSREPLYWSLAIAALFLALAFFAPKLLAPANRLWFRFGLLLHRIVSPVIMALLFYVAITPTGFVMKLFRKDILRLKYDMNTESYWIKREPAEPGTSSYKNQF